MLLKSYVPVTNEMGLWHWIQNRSPVSGWRFCSSFHFNKKTGSLIDNACIEWDHSSKWMGWQTSHSAEGTKSFTSISDIALKKYRIFPVKKLVLDKFDNYSKIDNILSPILIISGKKDEVVPHSHSKRLFLKANNPKKNLFIDEAMHNNLYDFDIDKEVISFNS